MATLADVLGETALNGLDMPSNQSSQSSGPPGLMAMYGDTVGLPGLLASGALGTSTIGKLLGKYGSSALKAGSSLGRLGAGGLAAVASAFGAGLTPWEHTPFGWGDGSFGAGKGETPQYIKDPATGAYVPNPDPAVLQQAAPQGMTPAGATPPPTPMAAPAAASPMQTAMAPAGQPAPPPQPASPAPVPSDPLSTTPPPNFGQGATQGGQGNGALSNLQRLFSGQALPAQSTANQSSNPMGNILPFISNLLQGGSSAGPMSPSNLGLNGGSDLPAAPWSPSSNWFNN